MSFPAKLTSVLTGVTPSQLKSWRNSGVFVPEAPRGPKNEVRYSFQDLVALRAVARLRSEVSLQKIRKALEALPAFGQDDHLSSYRLVTNKVGETSSVALVGPDQQADTGLDLVAFPGQIFDMALWEIFEPFKNSSGQDVVDFQHPAPHLEIKAGRLGGWPTIENTRIGYDQIANLQRGPEALTAEDVREFFPSVTPEAAHDALAFDDQVQAVGGAA